MIRVGDKVVVIRPEPNNIPLGANLQGTSKVGRSGKVIEIRINSKSFGGVSDIYQLKIGYNFYWWLLECEIELLEPKCILPDGVFRCKCGATTNRKEKKCCDCIRRML